MRSRDQVQQGTDSGGRLFITLVLLGSGAFMLAAGVWCLAWPHSFAAFAGFPYSRHFIHDAGAFQVSIGVTLLLAAAWADAAAVALAGFFAGNAVHAVNHVVDLDAGGNAAQAWGLGLLSLLVLAALVQRLRRLGYVVGDVAGATSPLLARFARQKTVAVTTYKRDGAPVATPVSVAVAGSHAYIRSYEKAWKVRRIRNNPRVALAPCTALGKPAGPAIGLHARRLQGAEATNAARILARKYPMLHRILVPSMHRLLRMKTGRTVHYELSTAEQPTQDIGYDEQALRARSRRGRR
jgi:PPOX class probable F420-dependent enzyme